MKLALITPKGVSFSNDDAFSNFYKSSLNAASASVLVPTKYMYWSGGCLGLLVIASLTPPE
ncbi:MAG TPA: hypothetical protein VN604_07850, partial [Nitrospirota bacterium]|nr:hypothetical protein [Nitrospirota bacterium]